MYRADAYGSEEDDLEEFILQYYGAKKTVPARLLLPRPLDTEHLNRYFREQHGKEVSIEMPEEGRDASIIRMAVENANQELDKQIREQGNVPALEELTRILELPRVPLRIEGFDIAHIGGKHPVGSLVSFLNGVPDKSEYRKFHVKRLEGNIDDFQAMREVIARRYQRVLNEKLARPDMILVDGGRGQVSAATEILKALELSDIPVVGLAKREEEIYLQDRDEPVTLPEGSPPLQLLQQVRDEAHRFATKFRAGQQKKDISVSTLESIPGIGPTRSKRLLRAFGSLETVAETPPDMIAKSCGINEEKAKEVKEKLRSELALRSGPDEASNAGDVFDDRAE
jgi:excinuclease ABC subunit C